MLPMMTRVRLILIRMRSKVQNTCYLVHDGIHIGWRFSWLCSIISHVLMAEWEGLSVYYGLSMKLRRRLALALEMLM